MCEKCQHDQSFLTGALVGGLVGAALGFLYAPQTGAETRKRVKDAAIKFKTESEPFLEEMQQRVAPVLRQIEDASEPVKQEFAEKINQLVDEVEEKIKAEKKAAKKTIASTFHSF